MGAMRQIRPDLYETDPFSPFDPVHTHAYLWTGGPKGNVLFYNTGNEDDFDAMEQLGGVAHHYPSHQDEFGPMLRAVSERFGAALHVAESEAHIAARFRQPTDTFAEHHRASNGVEVVPTPGHTVGSTSFVVEGRGGLRYLFTGDTLFRGADGRWRAGYIPGHSDAHELANTLDRYASLAPDLVVSSAFAGDTGVHEVGGRWGDVIAEARTSLPRERATSSDLG
jgi:hydroxyacylglutathione hydrolase